MVASLKLVVAKFGLVVARFGLVVAEFSAKLSRHFAGALAVFARLGKQR